MNTDSCDMARVDDDEAVYDGPPGAFFIERFGEGNRHARMWHKLPDGNVGAIYLRPVPPTMAAHPSWEWDGNEDKPTLKPSVHLPGRWHGWFTAGRMVSC